MPQLQVDNVVKTYATRGAPLEILRGVSLELHAGQSLAIVGPSGAGKSTLLNVIGALETPTSGRVMLDGLDTAGLKPNALAEFRNRQIGFVFQDHHLLPQCTVLENVLIPAVPCGTVTEATLTRAKELLARVGLAERMEHRPGELSGGERQRTAIARAMLNSPALLLADEPTGNLDRTTAEQLTDLLVELPKVENKMLIVVTHSEKLAGRMDRQCELDGGVLRINGQWTMDNGQRG
jgi:lipoprotein-releasing system ATP-binding protein